MKTQSTGKLKQGDKVAVLSPSAGLPELFPHVFEQGIQRLKDLFGFEIVEYPTTRQFGSSHIDRARDINSAFGDKNTKAIFASIGGDDQIQLLKLLDEDLISKNPKPFFGYSDNTHLHNYLWKLGIPSYYGGAILTQFAMGREMDGYTVASLKNAIYQAGSVEIEASDYYSEEELDWADAANLSKQRRRQDNAGFVWDIVEKAAVSGKLWGGCVDSMVTLLGSGGAPDAESLKGAVIFLETSDDIPEHWVFRDVLIALGERGVLEHASAVLVGRPKTWSLDKQFDSDARKKYVEEQRAIVSETVREYNKNAPIVQGMDFGHTDPQTIIPLGRNATIYPEDERVVFDY
jgi:muramoyltetrapeptide carboxypeptidase LdcA involved in peptidoglycan recycling